MTLTAPRVSPRTATVPAPLPAAVAVPRRDAVRLLVGVTAVGSLAVASLFVGVADLTPAGVLAGEGLQVLTTSRVPRTLALLLAGSGLAVAGLVMQLITRNVFTEPSTAGTLDFATLGLLMAALLFPDAPLIVRMGAGTVAALAGTWLFLRLLRAVPVRDVLVVPLLGLMLGGVVGALATFVAYRTDLLQSLSAWTTGDFSAVLSGRYELLWLAGAAAALAWIAADRFTVAGLGESFSTNLGLNYRRTLALGVVVVAVVSATIVMTVGALPFLGLVVPNVVRLALGDHARRSVPWVALGGAGLVVACDLVSRLVIHPFELPIGTVMGVLGAVVFLTLLLRGARRA